MKTCTTLGKQMGQMFILFDPAIQFGGLYNKKVAVKQKNKQILVRVIWFKNPIHHLLLGDLKYLGKLFNLFVSVSLSVEYI